MDEARLRQIAGYLDLKTMPPEQLDMLFIFGTRRPEPALIAADYLKRNAARWVVLTGGVNRYLESTEAEAHLAILRKHGLSSDRMIIEDRSSNTLENVVFAVPKIRAALDLDSIRTVAAVVKWYHSRRAIITLKRNLPVKARFFALTYEPDGVRRSDWWMAEEPRKRVLKEWESIPRYLVKGDIADICVDGDGFV